MKGNKQERSNKNVQKFGKEFSILLNFSRMDIRNREGEEMEERCDFHFLFIVAFSLAASLLKYSSTSSTRLRSFFTPGALFLTGSL